MDIKIIKSEKELDVALVRMGKLMELNPAENSKEAEEIKLLGLIIKDYEDAHYPTCQTGGEGSEAGGRVRRQDGAY